MSLVQLKKEHVFQSLFFKLQARLITLSSLRGDRQERCLPGQRAGSWNLALRPDIQVALVIHRSFNLPADMGHPYPPNPIEGGLQLGLEGFSEASLGLKMP